MGSRKSRKVTRYRKPLNLNIGIIIYLVILFYIVIYVFMYFSSKHIVAYEVQAGSLTTNNIYKGVALRKETIISSTAHGYVNYFAREGARVAVGDLVYTVDESGKLADYISAGASGENSLSTTDLNELKAEIVGFTSIFESKNFSSVYDFKYDIEGMVLKLANYNIMESISTLQESGLTGMVREGTALAPGIVVYSVDGYEGMTLEQMDSTRMDKNQYEKIQLLSNTLVSPGEPLYKLSTSEDWSLVIQIDAEREQELIDAEYVQVRFLKNQQMSWGKVSTYTNAQGEIFAQLAFTNSMITFCTDRFVDIELILEDEVGLKVPNSSIVEKEFFLVPKGYITKQKNGDANGVLLETYLEDGTATTEFIEVSLRYETDLEYYLEHERLQIGNYLIMPETGEKYGLSKRGSLIGVYNINKGYADFKQINILYSNAEYSIVQSHTTYGLSVYDYIVLDASTVSEDELIYE